MPEVNRGRIRATARLHRQDRPLIADYVLQHSDGLPVAVIEAKRSRRDPSEGFEQAKRYAELLDVPFAYATNGHRILELDARVGRLSERFQKLSGSPLGCQYSAPQIVESRWQPSSRYAVSSPS